MYTSRYLAPVLLTGIALLCASVASAQTIRVSASFNSTTAEPTAGATSAELGTVTLSVDGADEAIVTSLPLSLQADGGGVADDLSACQLMNGTGVALNTNENSASLAEAGGETLFVFDEPLALSSAVDTVLTLRCNVADDISSNATYTFIAGIPVLKGDAETVSTGTADSTTTAAASTSTNSVHVTLAAAPSVPAGSQNVTLATIIVAGSGNATTLSSIPVRITYGGNASNILTSCSLKNTNAPGTPLSSTVTPVSNPTTFTFLSPVTIAPNSTERFGIVCGVAATAPQGSSVSFAVDPQALGKSASGATSGTVSITGSLTTTPMGAVIDGSLPGIPNTGIGTDALATLLILALSLFAAFIGATVSRRMKETDTKVHA